MKVKLDENVTVAATRVLTAAGHEAETVTGQGLSGTADETLLAACRREGRVLVTFDLGFGDIRAHPPGTHAGVVLLRLSDQQPQAVVDVLGRLLAVHDLDELAGALVVVSDKHVRVRRP